MRDLFPDDWKPDFKRLLLDFDARVDSTLFQTAAWARELYERFTTLMDHFHVAGWKRLQ